MFIRNKIDSTVTRVSHQFHDNHSNDHFKCESRVIVVSYLIRMFALLVFALLRFWETTSVFCSSL